MRTVLAWKGEFGLKLYGHVPQVYALCQQEPCIVEIEEGEEALYPLAEEWRIVDRTEDGSRHGPPPDLDVEPERFVPEPYVRQVETSSDVVVCPRWREYGSAKNWPGWIDLTSSLTDAGLVVHAAGAPDSSLEVPFLRAWDYTRFLDASIEMMLGADLVVATDAGLAHLAVLCGADLLVVTHQGKVAPGPVVASSGAVAAEEYQRAGWDRSETVNRFEDANHTGARIEYVDGWEDVDNVAATVEAW